MGVCNVSARKEHAAAGGAQARATAAAACLCAEAWGIKASVGVGIPRQPVGQALQRRLQDELAAPHPLCSGMGGGGALQQVSGGGGGEPGAHATMHGTCEALSCARVLACRRCWSSRRGAGEESGRRRTNWGPPQSALGAPRVQRNVQIERRATAASMRAPRPASCHWCPRCPAAADGTHCILFSGPL